MPSHNSHPSLGLCVSFFFLPTTERRISETFNNAEPCRNRAESVKMGLAMAKHLAKAFAVPSASVPIMPELSGYEAVSTTGDSPTKAIKKSFPSNDWDTNAVWVDARQMMTTRTSDTQTQTGSQDTQPAGCHTP